MKKTIALILLLVLSLTACGNSETVSSELSKSMTSHDASTVKEERIAYPTQSEAYEYILADFPEYEDEIVNIKGTGVTLQRNGIVGAYFENGKFNKFTASADSFDSAFKIVLRFFSRFVDLNITADELREKMTVKTKMPKYTIYTYKHIGFEYSVTIGSNTMITVYKTASAPVVGKPKDCSSGHYWEEQKKTVNHAEEGHYEQVIVDYTSIKKYKCSTCDNMEWSSYDTVAAHYKSVHDITNRDLIIQRCYGTSELEPVYEKRWIVDKAAYSEEVSNGYKCILCGETKE